MTTNEELRKIFEREVEKAGGVSAWARANGFFKQRGNIDQMYSGKKKISQSVAATMNYYREWVRRKLK